MTLTKAIDRFFGVREAGSSIRREAVGGLITFMTMSYIIFVNPVILSDGAGMDYKAVMAATCIASAFATIFMALVARYPIALAPAMGHNAFIAYTICAAGKLTWQQALLANFVSGCVFLVLSFTPLRRRIMEAVPDCLKHAIAVGIGIFIALIGFQFAGVVVFSPATGVTLGPLQEPAVLVGVVGILLTALLVARRVPGALLIGIAATAAVAMVAEVASAPDRIVGEVPSLAPTLGKIFTATPAAWGVFLQVVFILLFLDMFDTIGTLIGVCDHAGLLKDGKLPRAGKALMSDAVGTVAGTLLGTTTVTSYIESASGVGHGARTGLASVVTGVLFIGALFFSPLVETVGQGIPVNLHAAVACAAGTDVTVLSAGKQVLGHVVATAPVSTTHMTSVVFLHPLVAAPLVVVGVMMFSGVQRIDWKNMSEALPAFLCMMLIPFTFSITDGIAAGFITYVAIRVVRGRFGRRDVVPGMIAAAFAAYYVIRAA